MRFIFRFSSGPQRIVWVFATTAAFMAASAGTSLRGDTPPADDEAQVLADNPSGELSFTYVDVAEIEVGGATVSTDVVTVSAEAPSDADVRVPGNDADRIVKATATHHQTGVIDANVAGQPKASITCFCLTSDDRILAACVGSASEIRVFDADGNFLETWSAPFQPDAIFARSDGSLFLAGQGKLAKLAADGEVLLECDSPNAAAFNTDRDKIREEVIAQAKQQAEMYAQQTDVYDKMLKQVGQQITDVEKQIAELDQAVAAASDDATADDSNDSARLVSDSRAAMTKKMLERRLAMQERMKEQYEQAKEQWATISEQNQQPELTDEQIEKQIESSIQYKLKASSISATESEVFLATHAAVGYGFDVWRMDDQFSGGEKIITGLSGCCGQMDVKANDDGLFIAENSRHRVCRYDREGKMIGNWGHGARQGLEGFGSCCNPMNVAFGPGGAVYTSEDDTGRIKRYSSDGELLGLVGAVDLTPGCKNVSIAVSSDGSRVYMMDLTQNRVLRMEPFAPGEAPAPVPYGDAAQADGSVRSEEGGSTDVGGGLVRSLKSIFGM